MKQALGFDCLPFDPFSLFQNGVAALEVDIGRCEVLQALMIAPVVVVIDESIDLLPEITGQVVVFQQDTVLSTCRRAGMSYCGPMVLAEMARLERDRDVQLKLLQEGEHVLELGSMSRNHFWFRRLAIEVAIAGRDPTEASRHAEALADFTRAQPLPWTDQYILLGQKFAQEHS